MFPAATAPATDRVPTDRVPKAARRPLSEVGFRNVQEGHKPRRGFPTAPNGLRRTEEVRRAVGRAELLRTLDPSAPVVLLSSSLPFKAPPQAALRAATREVLTAAVDLAAAHGGVGCLRSLL